MTYRKELGILLMEEPSGEVAVQLFADVESSSKSFDNMTGALSDPPRRATYIELRYGKVVENSVKTKMLPVIESVEDRPDGYVLGKGPVSFPKK